MSSKRILLTGCHGLLGQRIVQSIPAGIFVLGVDIDKTACIHGSLFRYAQLDITMRKNVADLCADFKPDWIINTASMTNVDGCETQKEVCWRINVEGVENLAQCAKKYNAKLLQISSYYIFDNSKERYREDDRAQPLNYYGKAKLASENTVRLLGTDWVIVRTSTLYDVDTLKNRKSFVSWVVHNLQQGSEIRIVTDQWGNPTLARNLAAGIWRIVMMKKSGVFHVCGSENVDRYSFTHDIAKMFGLDQNLVIPITSGDLGQAAKRPLKIGLDISRAEEELDMRFMGIKEGLEIFMKDYLKLFRNN